jgi:hypothetical protein
LIHLGLKNTIWNSIYDMQNVITKPKYINLHVILMILYINTRCDVQIDISRSSNHILHITTELFELFSFNSISDRFQVTIFRFDSVLKLLYFGLSHLDLKSKWSVLISKNLIWKPSRFEQCSVRCHVWKPGGLIRTSMISSTGWDVEKHSLLTHCSRWVGIVDNSTCVRKL